MTESLIITALLGLSLGSFLNVCIYRIPRGMSVVSPRSFCPACHRQLQWFELIPVLSFLLAGGKCRSCAGKISFGYPLMELFVGLLSIFYFYRFGISGELAIVATFSLVMLVVAMIDWKYFVIPNAVLLTGMAFGVILKISFAGPAIITSLFASALAFVTLFAVRYSGNIYFKKETMGFGDVKLAAVIGFFIGFQLFLVSLWIAAIVGIIFSILRKLLLKTSDEKIPLGCFLAVASVVVMVTQDTIIQYLDRWSISLP